MIGKGDKVVSINDPGLIPREGIVMDARTKLVASRPCIAVHWDGYTKGIDHLEYLDTLDKIIADAIKNPNTVHEGNEGIQQRSHAPMEGEVPGEVAGDCGQVCDQESPTGTPAKE